MPNTAEEQKQQTKKKYNNRRIDILLALFLIIAAGMSMFVLVWKEYVLSSPSEPTATHTSLTSPTTPTNPTTPALDTTDWLTYRNEEYGFEFKYPKNESREPILLDYNEDTRYPDISFKIGKFGANAFDTRIDPQERLKNILKHFNEDYYTEELFIQNGKALYVEEIKKNPNRYPQPISVYFMDERRVIVLSLYESTFNNSIIPEEYRNYYKELFKDIMKTFNFFPLQKKENRDPLLIRPKPSIQK